MPTPPPFDQELSSTSMPSHWLVRGRLVLYFVMLLLAVALILADRGAHESVGAPPSSRAGAR